MAQEYISIPIPVERVQEVYELLARRTGTPAPIGPAPGPDDFDAQLLARAYRESPDAMRKVFDYLADHAPRDVPMTELAKAVGYHPHQMAGALGAFGRRWKNRYHRGVNTKWPFNAVWDFSANMVIYSMPAEAASVIKAI